MKNEQRLIEVLKPLILAQLKKHPNELREGFIDKVLDHIEGLLQKSSSKNYKARLASVSKGSPEGKAAVKDFAKKVIDLEQSIKNVEARIAKERS